MIGLHLDEARDCAHQTQQRADELGIRLSSNESQLTLLQQTLSRSQRQMTQLGERREQLEQDLSGTDGPLELLSQEDKSKQMADEIISFSF